MFGRLGWAEILIIVVLVLILFGHNKIPAMMKNVADGLKTFKKEMKSDTANASKDVAPARAPKATKTAKSTRGTKTSRATGAGVVGAYVEFGAYASAATAQNAGRKLIANNADLFDNAEFVILNDASAGARSAFKLRVAFPSVAVAKKFQTSATRAGVKCRVVEI